MMMSEMIERVARAIDPNVFSLDELTTHLYWELWVKDRQEKARQDARRAIEAMRDPTADMITQGQLEFIEEESASDSIWDEMIDAALR